MAAILSWSIKPAHVIRNSTKERVEEQEIWVEVDGLLTGDEASDLIEGDNRFPNVYSTYPFNPLMYCLNNSLTQPDKNFPDLWVIKVHWGSVTGNPALLIEDPLKRPAVVRYGTYKATKLPKFDRDNKPVATTAGEPIVFQLQVGLPTISVTKNVSRLPQFFARKRDFVNKDAVVLGGETYKPFELYIPEISLSELKYENNFKYFTLDYTMYVEEELWKTKLRNAGYHERDYGRIGRPDIQGNQRVGVLNSLVPIRLGSAARGWHYPSAPVLIRPDGPFAGRAYRDTIKDADGNSTGVEDITGAPLALETPSNAGISAEEFNKAVITRQFYNVISFNQSVPLR